MRFQKKVAIVTSGAVYHQGFIADGKRVNETFGRAATNHGSGADGRFVPGMADTAAISKITKGIGLPVNFRSDSALPKRMCWRSLTCDD
jgi:2-methylisocitrate lyase-like PEP mutase family enzyme